MSNGLRIAFLRSFAGVMSAVGAAVIAVIVLLVMSALQGLGLVGGPTLTADVWNPVLLWSVILGFVYGTGVLKMRPSIGHGTLAFIGGFSLISLALMLLRWLLGLEPWNTGSILFVAGFLSSFAALWGFGAFRSGYNLVETAGPAVEHDLLDSTHAPGQFDPVHFNLKLLKFLRQRIMPIIAPQLKPLLLALGLVLLVIVVILVGGTIAPAVQIQTNDASASAVTPGGFVPGVTLFGGPVSKLGFFMLVIVFVFGGIASIALGLALLVNALSGAVVQAKKAPNQPLDYSKPEQAKGLFGKTVNFFIRLGGFFTEWGRDFSHWLGGFLTGRVSR